MISSLIATKVDMRLVRYFCCLKKIFFRYFYCLKKIFFSRVSIDLSAVAENI